VFVLGMAIVTCSDDGGDCESQYRDISELDNEESCPDCEHVFSEEAQELLR